jgi:hypothetical protein
MADKTASVRFDVKGDGFRSGMNKAKQEVIRGSKQMGRALASSMNAGAKAGLRSVRSMFSGIKTMAISLGGVLGGISFAGLVKGSVEAETKFRKLSFTMGAGRGVFEDYRALQQRAGQSALRWAKHSDQLADAMGGVFDTVGDGAFAKDTIDTIAMASRASGKELATLSPIVAEMNRQFGVTAAEVPDALARVLSLTARGALSTGDLGANMDKLGKFAKLAGLQGVEGMSKYIALVNEATEEGGRAEMTIERMNMVFTKLMGSADKIKKELKVDVKGMDAIKALGEVMRASKGDVGKLSAVFGAEAGVFLQAAFGGIKDLDAAMGEAAKGSLTAAQLRQQANENMKSSEAGITKALETMKQAFEAPEMQDAIQKLAENLPALAEAVAEAVQWITKNPIMSAGVLVGGRALTGGIGAGITNAFAQGGQTAATSIQGAMTTGGSSAAKSIAGSFAGAAALTGALVAWTVAADQYVKLQQDLEQMQKDTNDLNENLLQAAERRGEDVAFKEQSTAERLFGRETLQEGIMDVMEGRRERTILTRDPETGKVIERAAEAVEGEPVKVETPEMVMTVAGRRRADAASERMSQHMEDVRESVTQTGAYDWDALDKWAKAQSAKETSGEPKQQTQQLDALRQAVEQGPTRTLRVELTNPDAVGEAVASRSGAGKPGTPPAASHSK